MNAWCALWFWPPDHVGLLDGSDAVYQHGSETADALARLPKVSPAVVSVPPAVAETGTLLTQPALFTTDGEQADLFSSGVFESTAGDLAGAARQSGRPRRPRPPKSPAPRRRSTIALTNLEDWLDFAEGILGSYDIPPDTFLSSAPTLDELEEYEKDVPGWMGMDSEFTLQSRFPWLSTVETVAENQGFLHWELDFALIFAGQGGFDLQVGNPPWVRPRWREAAVLAEFDPWFQLQEKPPSSEKTARKSAVLADPDQKLAVQREATSTSGMVAFLRSPLTYPSLVGTQPDLYRAFMLQCWAHALHDGVVGLIHPDTHLTGENEGTLRAAAYARLRIHGDFVNAGNRFFPPPVGRSSHFGLHVYGPPSGIEFDNLSWLFSTETLLTSKTHTGGEPEPGVRLNGEWNARPHRARIVRVNPQTLAIWQKLTGKSGRALEYTPLLSPVSTAEEQPIRALGSYVSRLGQVDPQISPGYHESGAKEEGIIGYELSEPGEWSEVILKGTQLGVANSLYKRPQDEDDGEAMQISLVDLPDNAVPTTEYRRITSASHFAQKQDRWIDHQRLKRLMDSGAARSHACMDTAARRGITESEITENDIRQFLTDCSRRRYTEFYRLAWREFIAPDTERSLYVAVLPPGPSHVHTIRSAFTNGNLLTTLVAGFWASLPIDYLLRISGVRHLDVSVARKMPVPAIGHPLARPLLVRTARLNCLTAAYENLWRELFENEWADESWALQLPGLTPLNATGSVWEPRHAATDGSGPTVGASGDRCACRRLAGCHGRRAIGHVPSTIPYSYGFRSRDLVRCQERRIAGDRYTYGHGQAKEHWTQFLAYRDSGGEAPCARWLHRPVLSGGPGGRDASSPRGFPGAPGRGGRCGRMGSPHARRPPENEAHPGGTWAEGQSAAVPVDDLRPDRRRDAPGAGGVPRRRELGHVPWPVPAHPHAVH